MFRLRTLLFVTLAAFLVVFTAGLVVGWRRRSAARPSSLLEDAAPDAFGAAVAGTAQSGTWPSTV